MSHPQQLHFFQELFSTFPDIFAGKVLDIGSLEINGGPHLMLKAQEYVGVDLAKGLNVNLVSRGEDVSLQSNYFDASISSECFEHNPNWRSTLHNMIRMTRNGGIVAFSCATTGRPEHGTSRSDGGLAAPLAVKLGVEYYENVTEDDVLSCIDQNLFTTFTIFTNRTSKDLYFAGIKAESNESINLHFKNFVSDYSKYLQGAAKPNKLSRVYLSGVIKGQIKKLIPSKFHPKLIRFSKYIKVGSRSFSRNQPK
jgi:hypothetical protein